MAFVKVPEELLDLDITPGQLKILINLIRYSFDDGHSYIGYAKLAKSCKTDKSALIKNIQKLAQLNLIEITHRGTFSRSNDIKLTFENGLLNSGRISEGNSDQNTTKGCLNNTPKGCLNDTPKGCLNDTHGCLNDTPHKDIRFKYQDLNKNARGEGCQNTTPRVGSKQLEPADVTAGRTMPNSGCAGSARKEGRAEGAQLDIEDYCLWQDFKLDFSGCYPWLQLVRVQNHLLIRGLGRMGEDILIKAWDEVKAWFAARGVVVEKVGQSQRFSGEIIIKEAV